MIQNYYLTLITQSLKQHPLLGIALAGGITFLESLALIGSIIPGAVTLTTLGILIGTGILSFIPTYLSAVLGAFSGDSLSFYLGKYYQTQLLDKWPFKHYPKFTLSGENFFKRYGRASIFIGRFLGPIRCVLPVSAGILNMDSGYFLVADFASAIVWAPTYLLPGILIGAGSLELEADTGPRFILIVLAGLFVFWIGRILLKYSNNFLKKYISPIQFTSLNVFKLSYDRSLTCVYWSLLIFFALATNTPRFDPINQFMWHLSQNFSIKHFETFFLVMSVAANKKIIFLVSACLILFWITKHAYRLAAIFSLSLIFTSGMISFIKQILAHPRPPLYPEGSFSFPSGHTTLSTLLLCFCYKIAAPHLDDLQRQRTLKVFTSLILSVMCARLYLSAHWILDVLGGLCLGLGSAYFFASFDRPQQNDIKLIQQTLKLMCIATFFLTVLGKHFIKTPHKQLSPRPSLKFDAWWQQKTPLLPLIRTNYLGQADISLNLQWLSDPSHLIKTLKAQGWQQRFYRPWDQFNRFTHLGSQKHLPFLVTHFQFNPPMFTFTKQIDTHLPILIIYLWEAPATITHSKQSLYLGTVQYRYIWHIKKITTTHNTFPYPSIDSQLRPILAQSIWRKISYPISLIPSHELDRPNDFYLIRDQKAS